MKCFFLELHLVEQGSTVLWISSVVPAARGQCRYGTCCWHLLPSREPSSMTEHIHIKFPAHLGATGTSVGIEVLQRCRRPGTCR